MKQFIIVIILLGGILFYAWRLTTPPQSKSEMVEVVIEKGDNYFVIADKLLDNGLIRSESAFKAYLKLNPPKTLQACTYQLDKSWTIKQIIDELEKTCTTNNDVVYVTIPEGKHLKQVAEIVAKTINYTADEIMEVWTSEEFVDEVIEKYDFVTEGVKKENVRYSLEGYLFPAKYELLNKDVDPKYVAFRMLDQMDKIYQKYQADFESSKYSFHQLLTMASIVEYEAILDDDRPIIAGVFYNRLNYNMRFQSCATLGYALNEWKLIYSISDTETNHPYNTYQNNGFPPGPGGMPGEKSIVAALNPTNTEYLYFQANVCDTSDSKTYFAKNYIEHNQITSELNKNCQ